MEQRTDGRNTFCSKEIIWNMKVRNKGVYHGIIYDTNHWKQPIQVIGK